MVFLSFKQACFASSSGQCMIKTHGDPSVWRECICAAWCKTNKMHVSKLKLCTTEWSLIDIVLAKKALLLPIIQYLSAFWTDTSTKSAFLHAPSPDCLKLFAWGGGQLQDYLCFLCPWYSLWFPIMKNMWSMTPDLDAELGLRLISLASCRGGWMEQFGPSVRILLFMLVKRKLGWNPKTICKSLCSACGI